MGGHDLVALIFAREVSDSLTSLVKTMDKQLEEPAARRQGKNRLGVFVIFCSDDPDLKQQVESLAAKISPKNVILSTHRSQGPPAYRISPDADLTVAIYQNHENVAANFVLDADDLNAENTQRILKALTKVLP